MGDPRRRRSVAVHEAGHALVACAVGAPIARVSVEPDRMGEGFEGYCNTLIPKGFDPCRRSSEEILRRELVVAVAGPIAEKLGTGRCDRVAAAADTENTFRNAVRLVGGDLAGPVSDSSWTPAVEWVRRAQDLAESILRKGWRALEALVAALLERGALDGEQVRRVVRGWRAAGPSRGGVRRREVCPGAGLRQR